MPVDRIPPSSSLLEIVRALARDRARKAGSSTPAAITSAGTDTPPQPIHSLGILRQRLQRLLAHVDLANPQSVNDARNPALREILLWEFGQDFRRDPQFQPLTASINEAMEADTRLQQQFVELIAGLRKVRP